MTRTTRAAVTRTARLSVLARLQRGLEALYRVETQLDVESFLIDDQARVGLGNQVPGHRLRDGSHRHPPWGR